MTTDKLIQNEHGVSDKERLSHNNEQANAVRDELSRIEKALEDRAMLHMRLSREHPTQAYVEMLENKVNELEEALFQIANMRPHDGANLEMKEIARKILKERV